MFMLPFPRPCVVPQCILGPLGEKLIVSNTAKYINIYTFNVFTLKSHVIDMRFQSLSTISCLSTDRHEIRVHGDGNCFY